MECDNSLSDGRHMNVATGQWCVFELNRQHNHDFSSDVTYILSRSSYTSKATVGAEEKRKDRLGELQPKSSEDDKNKKENGRHVGLVNFCSDPYYDHDFEKIRNFNRRQKK